VGLTLTNSLASLQEVAEAMELKLCHIPFCVLAVSVCVYVRVRVRVHVHVCVCEIATRQQYSSLLFKLCMYIATIHIAAAASDLAGCLAIRN